MMVLHMQKIIMIMKWRIYGSKRSTSKLANHLMHYHRAISDTNNEKNVKDLYCWRNHVVYGGSYMTKYLERMTEKFMPLDKYLFRSIFSWLVSDAFILVHLNPYQILVYINMKFKKWYSYGYLRVKLNSASLADAKSGQPDESQNVGHRPSPIWRRPPSLEKCMVVWTDHPVHRC